jgi:hypothetical protein
MGLRGRIVALQPLARTCKHGTLCSRCFSFLALACTPPQGKPERAWDARQAGIVAGPLGHAGIFTHIYQILIVARGKRFCVWRHGGAVHMRGA